MDEPLPAADVPAPEVSEPIRLSDGTEINTTPSFFRQSEFAAAVRERPRASWPLIVLAVLAVFAVLYVARDVIVPMVFALMLALLFRPVLRRLKKYHVPNGIAAVLPVGGLLILFLLAIGGLAGQAQTWLAQAPETVRSVRSMLPLGEGPIDDLKEATHAVEELTKDEGAPASSVKVEAASSHDWAFAVVGVSGHFFASAMVVFVVCYFLLALSDQLLKQLVEAMPSFFEKRNVVQLVQNVEQGMSRYLATITIINICVGIITGLITWAMRIDNPILWGVLATTLNYVPHLGPFITMIVLFFVGSLAHQSLWYGGALAGLFALVTTAESYFITPLMLSRHLELSPLAVVLAVVFWAWMWGIGGGLLAAPMLAVFKIVCDQFESLHMFGAMLGDGKSSTRTERAAADAKAVQHQAA